MISTWSDFKAYVRADFRSIGLPLTVRQLVLDPVARFTLVMRLHEYAINTRRPSPFRLFTLWWFKRLSVRLGFSLGPNVFGPGVAIIHYGLLVIDPTTRIGRNCRVHMGTHIGGSAQFVLPDLAHEYSPRIGNNVYLGPGCKIYGPVVIGDNCVIGANAVVTRSFPDAGSVIAGVPARIIRTDSQGERVLKGAPQEASSTDGSVASADYSRDRSDI